MEFRGLGGRDLTGDIRKGVEEDRLIIFLRGLDTFVRLGEVSFDGID